MSKTNNMRSRAIRHRLLVTVSAAALLASAYGAGEAQAADNDSDRPVLWIELGGQFEQLGGQGGPFAPAFVANTDWSGVGLTSPTVQQKMNIFSLGEEASVSFQPSGSDWVFSGSIRYGRSAGHKLAHQQIKGQVFHFTFLGKYKTNTAPSNYAETTADRSEKHLIADFQAGKDVGLGMFGGNGTSIVSAGVRFAQFNARSSATIDAEPDVHLTVIPILGFPVPAPEFHEYYGSAHRATGFHGVGPSVSWKVSAPFAGNTDSTELTLDWGVNAAILFGRQKAKAHHHTATSYRYYPSPGTSKYYKTAVPPTHHGTANRNRSVVVPNLGGFAGLSFRYSDAKISFGYRGDFFFGAMDNGLDTRKAQTRSFYGPYASFSVGVGD